MHDPKQLREFIKYVLEAFSLRMGKGKALASADAVELLMFTAAHESKLGTYLKQLNGGPARGIFQIEPTTWNDVFMNYLNYREDLSNVVEEFDLVDFTDYINMIGNLPMQIIMARIIYLRVPEAIPSRFDLGAMAKYYKKYWNTHLGAATIVGALGSYKKYVTERERL